MRDDELTDLRARVDCRAVLERAGWTLDEQESTRGAAKYRHGAGRIVIVTHEGRGWFDPVNGGKGDMLALAQLVWGGTLGHARKSLRTACRPDFRGTHKARGGGSGAAQGRGNLGPRGVAATWLAGMVLSDQGARFVGRHDRARACLWRPS